MSAKSPKCVRQLAVTVAFNTWAVAERTTITLHVMYSFSHNSDPSAAVSRTLGSVWPSGGLSTTTILKGVISRYPIFIMIHIFLPPTLFLVTFLVLLSFILFPRLPPPLSRTSSLLTGQHSIGYLLDSRYWLPCGYKLHNPRK